jgi:uracil-DNA glycosylase family 4
MRAVPRARKKSVPGVGDVHAEWMFVGEGPGAEEDAKGEPFVGQAGNCWTTCWRHSVSHAAPTCTSRTS